MNMALRIFAPFAAGLFVSYIYRMGNATLESYLRADMPQLDKEDIGFITGGFFIAFAAAQLPLGIWMDRVGPRRVEAAMLLVAAIGALVFAFAGDKWMLALGRALMGAGVGICLMAAFKAFAMWFDYSRLPSLNAWVMAVGVLGSITSTKPVQEALQYTDWRTLFYFFSALTVFAAVFIYLVVPEKEAPPPESHRDMFRGLRRIWRDPLFFRIVPFAVSVQGAMMAVQALWAGPWMLDVRGFEESVKADTLLVMQLAMLANLLILGKVAGFFVKRGISLINLAATALVGAIIVQVVIIWNPPWMPVWPLLALLSVCMSTSTLLYAGLTQIFPGNLTGRLITSMNLFVFSSVFLTQWGIGALIEGSGEAYPDLSIENTYRIAFGVIWIIQIVAMAWYFLSARILKRPAESAAE